MARKFGVSLNENDPEEGEWVNGIDESGMLPAHVLKAALRVYFGTSPYEPERATNSDVVDAINAGFAMMAQKLDNVSMETKERPAGVARRESGEALTDEEKTGLSTEALVALKTKVARPGMRLEQ